MQTRRKKYHYLPTVDGGAVRKTRDDLTAKEQEFLRNTKHLLGRDQAEIDSYWEHARKMFE